MKNHVNWWSRGGIIFFKANLVETYHSNHHNKLQRKQLPPNRVIPHLMKRGKKKCIHIRHSYSHHLYWSLHRGCFLFTSSHSLPLPLSLSHLRFPPLFVHRTGLSPADHKYQPLESAFTFRPLTDQHRSSWVPVLSCPVLSLRNLSSLTVPVPVEWWINGVFVRSS